MPVRVTCPTCEARFEAAATARGAKVKCPNCGDFAKVPKKRIDADAEGASASNAKWIISGIIAAVVLLCTAGILALIFLLKPTAKPAPAAVPPPVVVAPPVKRAEPNEGFVWLDDADFGFSVQVPKGYVKEATKPVKDVASVGYIAQHPATKLNVRVRAYRFSRWTEPDAAAFERFVAAFEDLPKPAAQKPEKLGGLDGFEYQCATGSGENGLKDKLAKMKEQSENIPDPFAPDALEKLEKHLKDQKSGLEGIGDLLGAAGGAKKTSFVRIAAGAGKTVYVLRADPDAAAPDPFVWAVVTGSFALTR